MNETWRRLAQSDGHHPASQQAWALHECLRSSKRSQREVVSLAYLRDLSHSEPGRTAQAALGTVKTWIRRPRTTGAAWPVLPESGTS